MSIYVPRRLWVRVGEIASANDRSKSELVAAVLERWLRDYERKTRKR